MPKKKQKNSYYFEADVSVRDGNGITYAGKIRFVQRTGKTTCPAKLTAGNENDQDGYVFAEIYVEGQCPDRQIICAVRKPRDVLDNSIVFHFPVKHRQTYSEAIGYRQLTGMKVPWTASLSRKF